MNNLIFAGTAIPNNSPSYDPYSGSTAGSKSGTNWSPDMYTLTLQESIIGGIFGYQIRVWVNNPLVTDFLVMERRVKVSFDHLLQGLINVGWVPLDDNNLALHPPKGISNSEMLELLNLTKALWSDAKGKKDE
jgi:hypothetical protein